MATRKRRDSEAATDDDRGGFAVGDVVRVAGIAGPEMKVSEWCSGDNDGPIPYVVPPARGWVCIWWNQRASRSATFRPELLQRVEPKAES